ncbi:GGDEF domain-containing protein [Neobacillus sp. 3P2-tot-E-2]|uniref:GGDEF domain-containing protein n=1 Tax=Neobacillus sp. 3P2-tot-E-2 TaxID=3132212 RepID=UPI0039A2750B
MKDTFILTDFVTEQIFSIVRWIFLVVSCVVFYYPPIASIVNFELHTFNYLLIFGFTYMAITQVALWLAPGNHTIFTLLMKTGILFDYIALIWLLCLTGGVTSPLFPISYLLIIHSTIYWKILGAALSCTVMVISYCVLFWISLPLSNHSIVIFSLNITFLIVIGFFGALIVNRERHHHKLQYVYKDLVVRDYLTGLYNHRHFQESLKNSLADISKIEMSVVLADIDNFKMINDQHGHVVGDKVLMKIGEILQNTIPPSLGSSFRYGGEEFAILFSTTDKEKIIPCLEQVYKELREVEFTSENGTFSITMSFGLFVNQHSISNQVDLVRRADKLLYKAKHNGKNQAIFDCGTVIRG